MSFVPLPKSKPTEGFFTSAAAMAMSGLSIFQPVMAGKSIFRSRYADAKIKAESNGDKFDGAEFARGSKDWSIVTIPHLKASLAAAQTHAFVPCGHRCVCEGCSAAILASSRACPICCLACTGVMRVYIA